MNDVGTNLIGDPVSNPVSVLKAHSYGATAPATK